MVAGNIFVCYYNFFLFCLQINKMRTVVPCTFKLVVPNVGRVPTEALWWGGRIPNFLPLHCQFLSPCALKIKVTRVQLKKKVYIF